MSPVEPAETRKISMSKGCSVRQCLSKFFIYASDQCFIKDRHFREARVPAYLGWGQTMTSHENMNVLE